MVVTSTPTRVQFNAPTSVHSVREASLLQLFDTAPDQPTTMFSELRVAAMEYGRGLRKDAIPPERLVIELKALLCCRGGFRSFPSVLEEQRHHEVALASTKYARVLEWCLDGYFEEAPATTS